MTASSLRYTELNLLERANANGGTIAALRRGVGIGRSRREIPAAKVLISKMLAEKVDEGKTFLRIRLTSKGKALLSLPPASGSSAPRSEAGQTLALRDTEDFYNNPFHTYRGFRYYASAGVYRLTLPDGGKESFGAKQGGLQGLRNYVDAHIEEAAPS